MKLTQIKRMNKINKSLKYIKVGFIKCIKIPDIHGYRYIYRNSRLSFGNLYKDEFASLSYNVKYFNNHGHKMRFIDLTKNDITERSVGEANPLSKFAFTDDINYLKKTRDKFKYDVEITHFSFGNDVLSIYRRKIYKNFIMLKHKCGVFK